MWKVGRRTLACSRRLGWQISRWRQLWVKVGGAGSVELCLDGRVDEGEVGGVEGDDGSTLGGFLVAKQLYEPLNVLFLGAKGPSTNR